MSKSIGSIEKQNEVHKKYIKWEKVLWKEKSFPDNYTHFETFLSHLTVNGEGLRQRSYWEAVRGSLSILNVFSCAICLCAVTWGLYSESSQEQIWRRDRNYQCETLGFTQKNIYISEYPEWLSSILLLNFKSGVLASFQNSCAGLGGRVLMFKIFDSIGLSSMYLKVDPSFKNIMSISCVSLVCRVVFIRVILLTVIPFGCILCFFLLDPPSSTPEPPSCISTRSLCISNPSLTTSFQICCDARSAADDIPGKDHGRQGMEKEVGEREKEGAREKEGVREEKWRTQSEWETREKAKTKDAEESYKRGTTSGIIPRVTSRVLQRAVRQCVLLTAGIFFHAPLLRTMAQTVSSDSVVAMGATFLLVHVILYDYKGEMRDKQTIRTSRPFKTHSGDLHAKPIATSHPHSGCPSSTSGPSTGHLSPPLPPPPPQLRLNGALSLTAACLAVVLTSSQMPSDLDAFTQVLFSFELIILSPALRRRLRSSSFNLFAMSSVMMAAVAAALLLFFCDSLVTTMSFVFTAVSIVFIAPAYYVNLQKFRSKINGPWDEAMPHIRLYEPLS